MDTNLTVQSRCEKELAEKVAGRAKAIVAKHPVLGGHAISMDYAMEGDVLVVRGALPSFYLKQVLLSALKDLDGVRRVDNQVAVISSQGLSS